MGGHGFGIERAARGTPAVMEVLSFWTEPMCLCCCATVLQDIVLGKNMKRAQGISPYRFLQVHVNLQLHPK